MAFIGPIDQTNELWEEIRAQVECYAENPPFLGSQQVIAPDFDTNLLSYRGSRASRQLILHIKYFIFKEFDVIDHHWAKEFPGNISVCDPDGILLEMNERAMAQQEYGQDLIGTNILDCHPEPARAKLKQMLESGQANIYTIEKRGKKKLIYQAPWYVEGKYAGFVELALEIPQVMPHFVREG